MNTRHATIAAAIATSALLATAPAQAAEVAANRTVNIVGVPMKTSLPSTWPTFSPKALYASKTKNYPAGVRYLAKVEKVSPATFIQRNRQVNVLAYGKASNHFIPSVSFMSLGARSITVAQLKQVVRNGGGTVTTTSTVKNRTFGTAYRVHYRDRAGNGVRYNGVLAVMRVKGTSVVVDSSAYTSKQAGYISTLGITTASSR